MDNINWVSGFIYFGLIAAAFLAFVTLLIIVIILAVKKKSIKVPVITFVSILVSFSIIAGSVAFSDYQKDKWFYSFKSNIVNRYKIVKSVELSPGRGGLSLFVYCDKNTEEKDIEPIFIAIKNYLFDNPSGNNPSQQSYIKRGKREYTQIYISFYIVHTENAIVSYEAGYYKNGTQEKVDNFSTWYVDRNGEETQMTVK